MYVLYKLYNFPDPTFNYYELRFSNNINRPPAQIIFNSSASIINVIITQTITAADRTYDSSTENWTLKASVGKLLLDRLASLNLSKPSPFGVTLQFYDASTWPAWHIPKITSSPPRNSNAWSDSYEDKVIESPEEFFKSAPSINAPVSRASIEQQLSILFTPVLAALQKPSNFNWSTASEAEQKQLYRKAAILYHPDRNNGDSAKMSELNSLWSTFNSKILA
jgi:hypothetical protein